jgi:hypothetical protein
MHSINVPNIYNLVHFYYIYRYRKFQRMVYQDITPAYSIVPELMEGYDRADLLPRCEVAPDRVFLCRRVYDPRQKRIFKLGKHPY